MTSKKCIHTPSYLSAVSLKLPWKQCQYSSGWTQMILGPRRVEFWLLPFSTPLSFRWSTLMLWPVHVRKFLLPLSTSALQAADQMWCVLCLPVCLPVHFLLLQHGQCNRSTENCLICLVVMASASRADNPGFESRLQQDFSGVESYQWLRSWHSSGYPARRLAL